MARVVALGGRDFVLAEIARRNLVPAAHGLHIRRVRRREGPALPREHKCTYHGPAGCTLAPERRPATCNYFLCDDALTAGGPAGAAAEARARDVHAALRAAYEALDRDLAERIARAWPDGAPWDVPFLDWLGAHFSPELHSRYSPEP